MRRTRRVAVVTGSRADYGLLESTMRAVSARRALRLQVVVTGMHLLRRFGRTADEIMRDGWSIDARVKMQSGDDGPADQAEGLSRGVAGIARFIERAGTDVVVVLGDRIEAMAGALAGVTMGKLVAHIHGGDTAPGDFDEGLRHAITKLAHVHFVATQESLRRVVRMGEPPRRVHCVGAPGLDRLIEIASGPVQPDARPGRVLIVFHACGRPAASEARTMRRILRVAGELEMRQTIVYPNTDRGHAGIIEAIEAHARAVGNGTVNVFRSLGRDTYLRLLLDSDLVMGNSSSGIIEAPAAGTPSVNIGTRQEGRTPGGPSVVNAGESASSIRAAVHAALRKNPRKMCGSPYGIGGAGGRIARVLARMPINEAFRRKKSTY